MTDTSTRSDSDYVLGHADAELQRLAEQSAFYADLTEDAFRRAGLAPGIRVLDVGCGAGDVSLLAAAGGADSYVYRYIAATMRSLLPMFERLGVATAEEVDVDTLEARMRAKALEHASSLVLPTFVAAWARTPT